MHRILAVALLLATVPSAPAAGGELVPFKGTWSGSTVSAEPLSPTLVFVVTEGPGAATHLGRFDLTVPHLSYLDTLRVEGDQIFTAANGDMLVASFEGQLAPREDGCLAGTLDATFTSGTGRFAGATGGYDFHLVACPGEFGFDSTGTFEGVISR
jgi:hypothetical protein